jgi:hypothetical protein
METTLHLRQGIAANTTSPEDRNPLKLQTDVRAIHGQPTFHINGEPHHGLFSSAPAPYMSTVLEAGFDIVDTHPQTSTGWIADGKYDYASTDLRIASYLKQSPTALLIVRFWMGYPNEEGGRAPFWWAEENPEECIRPLDASGEAPMPWDNLKTPVPWNQLIAASVTPTRAPAKITPPPKPSFASRRFREEAGEALFRVIRHVEGKFGHRIAGYVIGGGPCGEWFHWHADEARMMDYSPPMRRHFRSWLEGKYETIRALNLLWNSAYHGFSEIDPPTPEERFRPAFGNLRSTVKERKVLDFYEASHQSVADTLRHWAARAKEGCDRRKVTMVFYGYLWNHNYGDSQARSGHARLEDILNCPDVDALVAPFCYSLRQMDGVITGQSLAASARRHGKLYIHELDGSTSLKPCWNCPDHHNPETAEDTGALFRRDLNKMLCEGSAGWFMDLRSGYFDSPAIITELRRTLESGIRARADAGRPNAQVAVVLDARTPFYFREGEPLLSPLIDAFKQHSLAKMGLGFDDLTMDDLASMTLEESSRYRFWIFPSAVSLSPAQRFHINRHACRNGNHVLWNYAVNVAGSPGAPDLDGMEAVTGFRCDCWLEPGELAVTVEPGTHPWTRALTRPLVYGTHGDLSPNDIKYHAILGLYADDEQGFQISPRFFIREGGQPLGVLTDLPGNPCGLAVAQRDGWVSILSCAPLAPPLLLRHMAASAGCHVFTDFPGQIVQCENHVGLFPHEEGTCQIILPHPCAMVKEIYSGQILGRHTDRASFHARKNRSYLLHYTPDPGL